MEPNSSLEKICLGDDVVVISSDKVEGLGDWNSPEYQDTAGSKGKKVINALSFYKMEIDEISERYIATCFMNGLEAYDGEVNLEFDENLISNEFAVKLCLDYEIHLRMIRKTGKSSDDWDQLLDFNFDDVPKFRKELPLFTIFISWGHLTQEEVEKEALAIRIGQTFAVLEEERPIVKEEEEAVKRIKGEALKEKDDPGAFIFPIILEGKVNENALADTGSGFKQVLGFKILRLKKRTKSDQNRTKTGNVVKPRKVKAVTVDRA
nr:hypothetical protein [Tanacetum cinerariifolium]